MVWSRGFRLIAVLGMTGLLAGCLSPLDQCLYDAGSQLRELREELAERQGNLTRGYRIERQMAPLIFPRFCVDPATGARYTCTDWVGEFVETRHPINPEIERERVALLLRQIAREERRVAAAEAQCRATYPAS